MAGCSHDCANCSEKCSKESLLAPKNAASNVKHVIGVVSGKGGVGNFQNDVDTGAFVCPKV